LAIAIGCVLPHLVVRPGSRCCVTSPGRSFIELSWYFPRPPLAIDGVRYVGERVAVVIAASEAVARDAAELVSVDYEVLPHVIEATLGHTIPGVAGVYRRHNFIDEKRAALEALAGLVAQIVEGNAT